ncbi:unnamed protein product [Arctogadus glacialis]
MEALLLMAGHGAGHERTHKPAIFSEASASSTSGTGLQHNRRAASFVKMREDGVGEKEGDTVRRVAHQQLLPASSEGGGGEEVEEVEEEGEEVEMGKPSLCRASQEGVLTPDTVTFNDLRGGCWETAGRLRSIWRHDNVTVL